MTFEELRAEAQKAYKEVLAADEERKNDKTIARLSELYVESYVNETQNIVRLEVDDGNGIQVIDIDSGKPFAIVLPLNVGNICFYDTNGNVVEYLRQQL